MPPRAWVLAALYVGVVSGLSASAFWSPDQGVTWREALAMLLTLPVLIPALPVIYVLGAAAWNLTDADSTGPMWPVTLLYTLMFAGVAVANVCLLVFVRRRQRRAALTG